MTAMISVEAVPTRRGWDCEVEVTEGDVTSRHNVRLSASDLERLRRAPEETPESLVTRTFEFLLAREAGTQILKSFEIADIQRYFPEFDEEIRTR
jgi:hypothetical protein